MVHGGARHAVGRPGIEAQLGIVGQAVVAQHLARSHHDRSATVVLDGVVGDRPVRARVVVDHRLVGGGGEVLDGQVLDGHPGGVLAEQRPVDVLAVDDRPGGSDIGGVVRRDDLRARLDPMVCTPGANQ